MRLPSATRLLADGIVQVLRVLAKLGPFELTDVAEALDCARYVCGPSLKGQADVDWTNPQARQRFLAEIVADADQLLGVVRGTRAGLTQDSAEDKELVAAAEVLARILGQDIERSEAGPSLRQGVAPGRLIAVHDPEMCHGRKSSSHRFNGHKAQVAVDTDSQLITAVDVLPGNAADADQALEVVEASEVATECAAVEVMGDCAYGAGSTRAAFAASGRTLVAKVPELHNQEFFAKTAFEIDLEAGTCTCPAKQETRDLRPAKGGGGTFVFATATCAACPVRAQCTRGQGADRAAPPTGSLAPAGARDAGQSGVRRNTTATPGGGTSHRTPGATGHSPGALFRADQDLVPVGPRGGGGQPDAARGDIRRVIGQRFGRF